MGLSFERCENYLSRRIGKRSSKAQNINSINGLVDLLDDFNIDKSSTVLEVGSFCGVSSELFALKASKVYCIDPWTKLHHGDYLLINGLTANQNVAWAEKMFDARMTPYDNVIKIKDFSHHVQDSIPNNSLDMIYIDGAHDYTSVRSDVLSYYPKLKVGGVLAGHDYYVKDIRRCVINLQKQLGARKKYSDTSWAFTKPEGVEISIPKEM